MGNIKMKYIKEKLFYLDKLLKTDLSDKIQKMENWEDFLEILSIIDLEQQKLNFKYQKKINEIMEYYVEKRYIKRLLLKDL